MTRFIWGLILVLVCGVGLSIHIDEIREGLERDWFDWILMVFCFIGVISGVDHIHESFDK